MVFRPPFAPPPFGPPLPRPNPLNDPDPCVRRSYEIVADWARQIAQLQDPMDVLCGDVAFHLNVTPSVLHAMAADIAKSPRDAREGRLY
jgi:hypothetical protein